MKFYFKIILFLKITHLDVKYTFFRGATMKIAFLACLEFYLGLNFKLILLFAIIIIILKFKIFKFNKI